MASTTSNYMLEGEKFVERDESGLDIVYLPDRGGNSIRFQRFKGKYYMTYYKLSGLQSIPKLELRSNDIYFPSYMRTGTHWTFEMMSMLLNKNTETIPRPVERNHIGVASAEALEALPSPRIICTHMQLCDSPEQLLEKKCKIVYKLRDPKDVAVSLYNLYRDLPFCNYQGEFKDFLYMFLEGKVDCNGMFDHLRDAEKFFDEHPEIPVHIQVYEETVENPVLEIQKLSDFLGLERDDDLCQAIADKCEFSRFKVDKTPFSFLKDGRSVIFRKGIVGDWKNWFTDEMLEDYYHVYEEKMAGSRFYERYAKATY